SLMVIYFKCGKVESAENIFKLIPKTTPFSWDVIISGYITEGKLFEELNLLRKMRQSSVEPDAITFTNVLAACSQLAALEKEGKFVHGYIIRNRIQPNILLT
ncbi:hypothetical protein RYX36_032943, partial [Vicia faba]